MSVAAPREQAIEIGNIDLGTRHDPLGQSFSVALVVFLAYFLTAGLLDESFRVLGTVALFGSVVFFNRFALNPWTWALVFGCLGVGIARRPLDVPHHHYLLACASLAFVFCLSAPRARIRSLLQHNFRWIVVAVMGIATLRWLFQPSFPSGYLGMEIAVGGFSESILELFPERWAIVEANRELVARLRETPSAELASVHLASPVPILPHLARFVAVVLLVTGAGSSLLMARCPGRRLTHLTLIAFGVTLAALRGELAFVPVLCLLGLFTLDPGRVFLRGAYAILAVLCSSVIVKSVAVDCLVR